MTPNAEIHRREAERPSAIALLGIIFNCVSEQALPITKDVAIEIGVEIPILGLVPLAEQCSIELTRIKALAFPERRRCCHVYYPDIENQYTWRYNYGNVHS